MGVRVSFISYDLESLDDFADAASKIEDCITDIRYWMTKNKLKLNDSKTEVMHFASAWKKEKIQPLVLKVGDHKVSTSSSAKNLGVILDPHLTMDKHVSKICQTSSHHLRNIGKLRKYMSKESLEKVTHAFISSRLDYNNSLLFGQPKKQLGRLQRLQNTAARIIIKTQIQAHISPELVKLHWLPVKYRIDYKILTLTYKCLNNGAPQYLSDLITPKVPSRQLRSSAAIELAIPPKGKKHFLDRSFSYAAPTLWNKLSVQQRNCESLTSFKSIIKTHLFKQFINSLPKEL